MVELRLDEVAGKTGGTIIRGDPSIVFRGYNIDSRLIRLGDLFFAVTGKRDGHDFVSDAADRGARGAVVSRDIAFSDENFALVRVQDTVAALQSLAKSVLEGRKLKVIGITGSAGKTTTKEFAASLLSSRFKVLKSEGNFNNHLGLPLSLLKMSWTDEVAVLEMAMNGPGEIRALTKIAAPDIAVITNIRPVHLEFFSGIEEIALAKKEILEGAKIGGTAVLNGDDSLVMKIAEDWKGGKVTFGFSPDCDVRADRARLKGLDGMSFRLRYGRKSRELDFPFFQETQLLNFLAACGAAFTLSLPLEDIAEKILFLKPLSMRGNIIRLEKNIQIIDESYNSNPAALEAALKAMAAIPAKRKIAVLGDMLELGPEEVRFHRQAGKDIARLGLDILVTVGPLARRMAEAALTSGMKENQVFSFPDSEEAARKISPLLEEGDLILIKGSRCIQTEKIVAGIRDKRREI